jgi:UDP-glucuronate decarboxylase
MRELAEQIVAASGSQSSFTHLPLPEDDPRQRRPDIRLAWELLEWEPRVDLTAGLDATIRYFRERTRPAA